MDNETNSTRKGLNIERLRVINIKIETNWNWIYKK